LLTYLLDAGFDRVPAPLGLDDRGREILSCGTRGGVEPGGVLDAVASFHERDRSRTVN